MSVKGKIAVEDKVSVVRAYINNEIGLNEAARRVGVNKETVAEWIRNYTVEGVTAFIKKANKVYGEELKRRAVEMYLSGEGSLTHICKSCGIRGKSTLINWIKMYNGGGDLGSVKHSGGGSYMKQGRETTQAERIEIAKACLACGKNYGEVALKYQVSYQQARSWTKRFEELGEAGLEDRRGKRKKDQEPRTELEKMQIEIEQLKHKLYLAELERDLLKKLDEIERGYVSAK